MKAPIILAIDTSEFDTALAMKSLPRRFLGWQLPM